MIRTLCSHCWGSSLNPAWGINIPQVVWHSGGQSQNLKHPPTSAREKLGLSACGLRAERGLSGEAKRCESVEEAACFPGCKTEAAPCPPADRPSGPRGVSSQGVCSETAPSSWRRLTTKG